MQQNEDGSWIVLNREYKPLGFNTRDHIDYDKYPIATKFKGLGPAKLQKLSYTGKAEGSRIYFYNDKTNPINGAKEMRVYLERLELLAKIKTTK